MTRFAPLVFCVLLLVGGAPLLAQDTTGTRGDTTRAWHDDAWSPIVTRNGVQFDYLFYSEADNVNNGVVIRLRNHNSVAVRYSFTVIFRGPEGEARVRASGRLNAGEMKTGETDGLFWIPFKDGRSIGEVGLRGIEIRPLRESGSSSEVRG